MSTSETFIKFISNKNHTFSIPKSGTNTGQKGDKKMHLSVIICELLPLSFAWSGSFSVPRREQPFVSLSVTSGRPNPRCPMWQKFFCTLAILRVEGSAWFSPTHLSTQPHIATYQRTWYTFSLSCVLANANRNSSPAYRWAMPFTRLKRETSFGTMLKRLYEPARRLKIDADVFGRRCPDFLRI